jgi:transmembrane sensor
LHQVSVKENSGNMKRKSPHNNLSTTDRRSREFFSRGDFSWNKSQEKVWSEIESRLNVNKSGRTILFNRYMWAIAAGFLILVASGTFMRFYRMSVSVPAGMHQTALLPDGSEVELNAVSSITYHPYWWRIKRMLSLDGEAHFEIAHGKNLSVISEKGKTEVLGTSFNIFSRKEVYQVTCLSGKVRVTSLTNQVVTLSPNSKAEIQDNGEIKVSHQIDPYPVISWRNNIFLFTAKPVNEVFSEIERQYNITIETNLNNIVRYSGNFTKEQHVEEILSYICPALNLKFSKKSATVYSIIQENEWPGKSP